MVWYCFYRSKKSTCSYTIIDCQYSIWYRVFSNSLYAKRGKFMKTKQQLTDYYTDLNLKASIAFGISLIVLLLAYLAFFK